MRVNGIKMRASNNAVKEIVYLTRADITFPYSRSIDQTESWKTFPKVIDYLTNWINLIRYWQFSVLPFVRESPHYQFALAGNARLRDTKLQGHLHPEMFAFRLIKLCISGLKTYPETRGKNINDQIKVSCLIRVKQYYHT